MGSKLLPAVWVRADPAIDVVGASVSPGRAGTDIPGTARVQGDEFTIQGLDGTSMYIELRGSFVAPADVTDSATVTVPFTSTGLLARGYPLPSLDLTGNGTVTLTLTWQPFLNGWAITYTSFAFGKGGGPE